MEIYLCCENCFQTVAKLDLDTKLFYPIQSDMFKSKFPPERGVPKPWVDGVPSQFMKCPLCPKRVFNDPNPKRLLVSENYDGTNRYWLSVKGASNAKDDHAE